MKMNFWDKKIETIERITFEGNKKIDEKDYTFKIHYQNGKFAFSNSIEVKHLVHGETDWSTKSISFTDLEDLERFIEMLNWLKEEIKTIGQ